MMTIVDDKQIGFSLGAADYFTKPIDWTRLSQTLKKYQRAADPHTVLVVEDDERTREMLRRLLQKERWSVVEARNGREGLERLDRSVPTLILLDLLMPELDGFQFMQALRERTECKHVPVIVITAKDLTEEDRRRLNGEVARIVTKSSLTVDELLDQIQSVTGLSKGAGI